MCVYIYIYVFLTVLGLSCSSRALSSCSEWGPLSSCRLLNTVASLVVEHGLWGMHCFSICSTQAQQLCYMGLVAPGHVESSQTRDQTVSSALAVRFLTTGPPGKSYLTAFLGENVHSHSKTYVGFLPQRVSAGDTVVEMMKVLRFSRYFD